MPDRFPLLLKEGWPEDVFKYETNPDSGRGG
jgi:hypothetical protein